MTGPQAQSQPSSARRSSSSRETGASLDKSRPRSPKPEADGKLDRAFKFPLKDPAASPVSPTSTQAPQSATIASISADSATADPSATSGVKVNGLQASAEITSPDTAGTSSNVSAESPVATSAIPATVVGNGSVVAEPADLSEAPETGEEPSTIASSEPTDVTLADASAETSSKKASTIDEAIDNFHSAVKTPSPAAASPADTEATAIEPEVPHADVHQAEPAAETPAGVTPSPSEQFGDAAAEAAPEPTADTNGNAAETSPVTIQVNGGVVSVEDIPAVAPKTAGKGIGAASQQVEEESENGEVEEEEQGEGVTMDEIDLT